ncbi:MAG: pantoate--beta-alanine ligase [Paraglaciecola sp.]|jgi:pantoate--beta-alanine ligase
MLLYKNVKDLQAHLGELRKEEKSIGFIPTMGALHEGHLSLIKRAIEINDAVVCCIFVNPTQFNEASDLDKYPRTPGKDVDLLAGVGCDVIFMPPVEEVYPKGKNHEVSFDFEGLDMPMEGANRPGHFAGVAQVIYRLLEIVQPDHIYMGQKDFQQYSIVRRMLVLINSKTQVVMCEIIREADGLAKSSRNVRLTPEHRAIAPKIQEILLDARSKIHSHFPRDIEKDAMTQLKAIDGFEPEYFTIAHGRTLQPFDVFEDVDFAVVCTAVWAGEVRLIDNVVLKRGKFE